MSASARQLPRGRHRLTREQVLASQRGRMLRAIAQATAQKGFVRVTVADVISEAGVSRETFYEQFTDKEDCFLQALDAGVEGLLGVLGAALELPDRDPLTRLDHVLGAYLEALAAEPAFAKAFLIDAYGAGQRAIGRRIELQQRFVEVVSRILGVDEKSPVADRFACESLVAAASSLVTARVGAGRTHELPQLRGPMLELVARLFPA